MEDCKIIRLYWGRSEEAIAETKEKYGRYCYTISYNILENHQDAEECVSDTWLRAWNSMPPQKPKCLKAFLGAITRNLSLNRRTGWEAARRGRGQTALALEELQDCIPAPGRVEEAMEEKLVLEILNQFLKEMKKEKRQIFVERYWYLKPVKEIAAGHGISESKAVSILFRLRKELKKCLEKEGVVL